MRWGNDRRHLLLLWVVAVSAGLRILLLLVLSLLLLLEFLLLLAVFFLAMHLARCAAGLHVLQLAVGVEASVVFGSGDILAVLEEGDGGDNESADERQAADVLDFVSG